MALRYFILSGLSKFLFGGKVWSVFGEVERRGHFLRGGWCQ